MLLAPLLADLRLALLQSELAENCGVTRLEHLEPSFTPYST